MALVVVVGLVASLAALPFAAPSAAAEARSIDSACPDEVPPHGFTDVPDGNVHGRAVACLVWWGITTGTGEGRFDPAGTLSRGQFASFVHRLLVHAGAELPADPPNAFGDDDGSVHAPAIDALAAAGVLTGFPDGTFRPDAPITRGQLASLFVAALAWLRGEPLPDGSDAFGDDDGSVHEPALDAAFAAGLLVGLATSGNGGVESGESQLSRRDQTASVFIRGIGLLVDEGRLDLPGTETPEEPEAPEPGGGGGPGDPDGPDDPDDPDDPPPFDGAWIFEPQALLLAPGAAPVEATLTFVDADGNRTTPSLPDGTTFELLGDDAVTATDDDGDGTFVVDPGDAVGSAALVAVLPDTDERPVLYVTVARLQDGVVPLTDDQILHPAPNMPPGADTVTGDGPGPFTWLELAALTDVPSDDEDPSPDDVLQPDAQVAIVVHNPAPAVGELIVGVEGAPVLGRVVSVEQRGEFSLLAVRLVPLGEIYAELDFNPCEVPDDPGGAPAHCTTPPVEPTELPPDAGGEPVAADLAPAPRSTSAGLTAQADGDDDDGNCEASLSGVITDFKLLNVAPSLRSEILSSVQVADGVVQRFFFLIIFDGSISAGVTGSVQAAIDLGVACTLVDIDTRDVPIPGPLAPFFTATVDPDIVAELQLKVAGGPKIDLGYSCTINVRVEVGFDYKAGVGGDALRRYEPPNPECAPVWKVQRGEAGDAGLAMSAEFNLGVALQFAFGGRIGGKATNVLAEFLGDEELGKVDLVTVKVGPRLHLVWENTAQVLVAEGAGSVLSVELVGSASAGLPPLEWLIQKVSGNPDLSLEITLFEGTLPLLGLYRSMVPGPSPSVSLRVNGVEKLAAPGSVAEVTEGDELELRVTHSYGPVLVEPPSDAPFSSAAGNAWVTDSGPLGYEELGLFDTFNGTSGSAPVLTSTATVTEDDCDALRGDTPHTVAVVPEALLLGVAETQGWGGTFQIRCSDPEVRFATPAMRFEVQETTHTVRFAGIHTEGWDWELDPDGDFPDWLQVTPASGTFADEVPAELDLTVTVDCGDLDEVVTHTVTGVASTDGTDLEPTDTLEVTADCRDEFLEFRPDAIQASGASALTSFGEDPTTWTISGGGGNLEVSPTSGSFGAGGLESTAVSFRDTRRDDPPPPCDDPPCDPPPPPPPCAGTPGSPAKPGFPEETVTLTATSPERGTATIVVTLPEIPPTPAVPPTPPPDPCPSPPPPPNPPGPTCCGPGGGWGDPHMTSIDGVRYDAQVVGEYTYLAPIGFFDGPTLQARHEYFSGHPGRGAPTSITGIAVQSGDHTVDLVARPTFVLHVDGEPVTLENDAPFAPGPELSILRTGNRYRITTPAVTAVVDHRGHYFDLDVTTAGGRAELAGFLGRPNGDPSDDITTADGTTFTLAQIRGHTPEMYEFTDSWRVTDLGRSLFTETYDGFADQNIPFSSAALEPFRQQVRDALGTIARICSTAANVSHVVEALAIELAAGRTIEEAVDYTCGYPVDGRAFVGGDTTLPASGVQVHLDGPGLAPCTTTTDAGGSYRCVLSPDLAELGTLGAPALPLTVAVTATWPDGTAAAAPTQATFTAFAPLDRWAPTARADLAVDPATVAVLDATGAISDVDGHPVAEPVTVVAVARSATGEVGRYRVVVSGDASNGRYRLTHVLPRSTESVELLVTVGGGTHAETFAVTGFGRLAVTFDVVFNPPVLQLSGAMTGHEGAALAGPVTVAMRSFDGDGAPVGTATVDVDPGVDGAYALEAALRPGTQRVEVVARVGQYASDWVTQVFTGIVPGPNPVLLDVAYDPPVLDLGGRMTRADGSPITDPVDVELRPTAAGGEVLSPHVVTVDPGDDGSYALAGHLLPSAATAATLTFRIGDHPSGWVTSTVEDLVPGPNARTVDVVVLGFGDVQVTLQWTGARDLDLHVTDPFGEHIYYADKLSASGGQLDVDDTNGCPPGDGVENVFWPPGGAPPGDYLVLVHHFSGSGCPETPDGGGDYVLTIRVAGRPEVVHTGHVGFGESDEYEFTVEGAAAAAN